MIQNLVGGPRRLEASGRLVDEAIAAEFRSPLWSDGRDEEFLLRCGKVQNLRVAIRNFNGIEVEAGRTLSFWSQVGYPSTFRGFVVGREIIAGCVVPTIGGGLCQLSNALASAASAAGIDLVERHRHSALIEGPSTPAPEDATVAWNYVDLQLRADFAFRLEVELTSDELVVRVRTRGREPMGPRATKLPAIIAQPERPTARGCLTCNEIACFRYSGRELPVSARTAVLVNDKSPEMEKWLQNNATGADWMLPWQRPDRRQQHGWRPPTGAATKVAVWPSLRRIVLSRLKSGEGGALQAGRKRTAKGLAAAYARSLLPEHASLIVSQDLLVPLRRLGVLGGRTYSVFLTELPATEIQTRLDLAASKRPEAQSLRDFRVETQWGQDEWAALASAANLFTAHRIIHEAITAAGIQIRLLPWVEPPASVARERRRGAGRPTLTLAASALARKGALEVADVARSINAQVLILGSAPTDESCWRGVDWKAVGYGSNWLEHTDIALLPAHVEHQPRALLRALAAGIPVVASPACGIGMRPGLTEVEPGDVLALEAAVRRILDQQSWC